MWLDRIGILVSLVGFLLLIPETLYGIVGIEKLDQLRQFTLRSIRALSLLQEIQHKFKAFKASHGSSESFTQRSYDKSGRKIRVVLASYWLLLITAFFTTSVVLTVRSVTHNSNLELIWFQVLFGILLATFVDYAAGSRNWKELLVKPAIIFGPFVEGLWPLSLLLVLMESGLRKLFSGKRDFRLALLFTGIFLNVVGLTIQFLSTFK